MTDRKKILAICGSTRQNSSNHNLLKAIQNLSVDSLELSIFDGLSELPHFNPDYNNDNVFKKVKDFRNQINNSDGIIICTPEYAHGVPGSLKNAIDWTVSTNEFYHKPTVLITASTDGEFGHKALLETLRVIEAKNIDQLNLLIQFVRTKTNANSEIADEKTLLDIKELLSNFILTLNEQVDLKE